MRRFNIFISIVALLATGLLTVQASSEMSHNADQMIEVNGFVDRVEDNLAVILIETLYKEMIVPIYELPKGTEEKMWVIIKLSPAMYEMNTSHNESKNQDMQKWLERLRKEGF